MLTNDMHEPESVQENGAYKIFWDFDINPDQKDRSSVNQQEKKDLSYCGFLLFRRTTD